MGLLPRSAWSSTPRPIGLTPLDPAAVKGLAVHWPGAETGTWGPAPTLAESAARLEAERAYHVTGKGWSDVAYSAAVDLAGRMFDCRGLAWRPASNGNQTLNAQYPSVTVLMGPGDAVTPQAVAALRAVRAFHLARYPHATAVVGHRDLWSTDCPGPGLYQVVRSGILTSAPLEADVPLDQADMKAIETLLARVIPGLVWGSTWPAGHDPESGGEVRESAQDRLLWASRGSVLAPTLDSVRSVLEEIRSHVAAGAVVTLSAQQVADIAAAVDRAPADPAALAGAVVRALGAAIQCGQPSAPQTQPQSIIDGGGREQEHEMPKTAHDPGVW